MGTVLPFTGVSVVKAVDVTKLLAVASVVMMLAVGACSVEPDQGTTTTATTGTTEQLDTSTDGKGDEAVETDVGRTNLERDDPVQAPPDTAGVTTTEASTSSDEDAAVTPPDDASPLPEPGDGLEHPKAPNPTMIVPPPQD